MTLDVRCLSCMFGSEEEGMGKLLTFVRMVVDNRYQTEGYVITLTVRLKCGAFELICF